MVLLETKETIVYNQTQSKSDLEEIRKRKKSFKEEFIKEMQETQQMGNKGFINPDI